MQQITLCANWTGLCNQLFALANGILQARRSGKAKALVGTFAPELNSARRIPITSIIDLNATSQRIGLVLTAGATTGPSCFAWYNKFHEASFVQILRSIQFQPEFYTIAQELAATMLDSTRTLHVVHFRIEQDGITHWSRMNKMTPAVFKQKLHGHYKKAIAGNIPKSSQILALTFDVQNPLLLDLAKEYTVVSLDTRTLVNERLGFGGREVCAIIDLLVGITCKGTFIGCHNMHLKRGSTFSYTLWKLMTKVQRGVFIDLDNINAEQQIYKLNNNTKQ